MNRSDSKIANELDSKENRLRNFPKRPKPTEQYRRPKQTHTHYEYANFCFFHVLSLLFATITAYQMRYRNEMCSKNHVIDLYVCLKSIVSLPKRKNYECLVCVCNEPKEQPMIKSEWQNGETQASHKTYVNTYTRTG